MNIEKNKIKILLKTLSSFGLNNDARLIKALASGIGGVDYPLEEIELDTKKDLFEELELSGGEQIFLDSPAGTNDKFRGQTGPLPFHYGEFPRLINPADDMGWDIIIVPSQSKGSEVSIDEGHNFVPVGYVKVNGDEEEWMAKAGKSPPVGNDKIILADNGFFLNEDKSKIEDFFSSLWQFKEVIWF